jgi:hypothetical protein
MNLDKFAKYALAIMATIVAVLIISTYIGYQIFGPSILETKYLTVIEDQARQFGLTFGHVIELGEMGEYIGFTIAGVVSGFAIGYLFPSVFESKEESKC